MGEPPFAECHFCSFWCGNTTEIDKIIVHWRRGDTQILKNQKVNQMITITEEKHLVIWPILKWILVDLGLLAGGWYFWRKNK